MPLSNFFKNIRQEYEKYKCISNQQSYAELGGDKGGKFKSQKWPLVIAVLNMIIGGTLIILETMRYSEPDVFYSFVSTNQTAEQPIEGLQIIPSAALIAIGFYWLATAVLLFVGVTRKEPGKLMAWQIARGLQMFFSIAIFAKILLVALSAFDGSNNNSLVLYLTAVILISVILLVYETFCCWVVHSHRKELLAIPTESTFSVQKIVKKKKIVSSSSSGDEGNEIPVTRSKLWKKPSRMKGLNRISGQKDRDSELSIKDKGQGQLQGQPDIEKKPKLGFGAKAKPDGGLGQGKWQELLKNQKPKEPEVAPSKGSQGHWHNIIAQKQKMDKTTPPMAMAVALAMTDKVDSKKGVVELWAAKEVEAAAEAPAPPVVRRQSTLTRTLSEKDRSVVRKKRMNLSKMEYDYLPILKLLQNAYYNVWSKKDYRGPLSTRLMYEFLKDVARHKGKMPTVAEITALTPDLTGLRDMISSATADLGTHNELTMWLYQMTDIIPLK